MAYVREKYEIMVGVVSSYDTQKPSRMLMPERPDGKFSLYKLRRFMNKVRAFSTTSKAFIIDFRSVSFWDPAALLWFSLALRRIRDIGYDVKLLLPDARERIVRRYGRAPNRYAQESGDFLRRWQFDVVLGRVGRIQDVLVREQHDYFDAGMQVNYLPTSIVNPYGQIEEVLSTSLFPFFDFSALEWSESGPDEAGGWYSRRVSRSMINGRMRDLYEGAMAGVFTRQCGISAGESRMFVGSVVGEALDNMERHPHASLGMMAINRSIRDQKLVLAVVDDGESICRTILKRFNADHGTTYDYNDIARNYELAGRVLDYSTMPEVSSHPESSGMGLYYMKKSVVDLFGGSLQIITSGVECTYGSRHGGSTPSVSTWRHGWEGNLIRVEIPIGVAREQG